MAEQVVAARAAAAARSEAPRIVLRPKAVDDTGFTVVREEDGDEVAYRVRGERPQRWVRQTDFSNDEAVGYLADRLARLGVEDRLLELGADRRRRGLIGDEDDAVVFDWEPTAPPARRRLALEHPLAHVRAVRDRPVWTVAVREACSRDRCARLCGDASAGRPRSWSRWGRRR